jgi:transposase InsO family protein
MNIHRSARSTLARRVELVKRVLQEGWTMKAAAFAAGISERRGYEYKRRYLEKGELGLVDRSSRPKSHPWQTDAAREATVVELRELRFSMARIAHVLSIPRSTVQRVCSRKGITRLPPLQPRAPVVRYQRERPGELIHLDTKKLGRIERVGHRIHGDRTTRVRGTGWEYVHVCIDDASRAAYVEVLPDEKGKTVAAFLKRATAWYAERGVVVERVMTDNGSGYVSKVFAATCRSLQQRHLRTRPYTPKTNGKAERLVQTLLREWAYAMPYAHSRLRTAALKHWLRYYNEHRPHSSLGAVPPLSRLLRAA